MAIRPEHISIAKSKGNLGEARITDVVYQGSYKRVLARRGETQFIAHLLADTKAKVGDTVQLSCEPQHMVKLSR